VGCGGLWLVAEDEGVFPWGLGRCFWYAFVPLLVCISAPFGMNGVVSGAFSGSFRCGEFFSGSDA